MKFQFLNPFLYKLWILEGKKFFDFFSDIFGAKGKIYLENFLGPQSIKNYKCNITWGFRKNSLVNY